MEEPVGPSKVLPVLVAVLVCDAAVEDPSTGKKSLIGVFDRIWVARFPTSRPLSVYMKLGDAEGRYRIEVRYVRVSSGQVLAGAMGEGEITSRLASIDLFIPFDPLPIPGPDRYEFQILANGIFLGSTFIDAVPRERAQEGRAAP